MHGDSQRLRPDVSPPSTSSAEDIGEAVRSGITNGASPLRLDHRPHSQTSTVPSSWKDVLKSAIWHLLPSDYPGLSATEVRDRLREQGHELLQHQSNLKSFQSAIYASLNEMMFVYVDKRRLKGARNHHQYIALQRKQGGKTQGQERTDVPKSSAPMEDNARHARPSVNPEAQETTRSPERRLVETQISSEHTADPKSPPGGFSKTQTALAAKTRQDHGSQDSEMTHASAEHAQLRGSAEETRNDVVETQSQNLAGSSSKERGDKNQPSTPATTSSKSNHIRPENTNAMRDHGTSGDCLAETPSNAFVVRLPTVLLPSNGSPEKTEPLASSRSVQSQVEQPKAGCRAMQQASNKDSMVVKPSQSTEALHPDASKTSQRCEAPSNTLGNIQGEALGRATISPCQNGVPTQQDNTSNGVGPINGGHTTQVSCREQTCYDGDVKNAVLMELGKKVKRAHSLRAQCEAYTRERMGLQAKSTAKQAALAESIDRANEDIALFNELNSRHQDLQAQFSDSERRLADARRRTVVSRDVARHKDTEYQTHAAWMAQLTKDHASADRDYQNELRSLGLG